MRGCQKVKRNNKIIILRKEVNAAREFCNYLCCITSSQSVNIGGTWFLTWFGGMDVLPIVTASTFLYQFYLKLHRWWLTIFKAYDAEKPMKVKQKHLETSFFGLLISALKSWMAEIKRAIEGTRMREKVKQPTVADKKNREIFLEVINWYSW